jgi:hypothetical protein
VSITPDQLRAALAKLNGKRDVRIRFDHADPCVIAGALLVPVESDKIIKLTDGSREYLVDAERVAWVEIG